MNINEALAARLPLPWKQSTCDGPPIWKVERRRPEDFTADIYQKLKKYGMKEDEIRNLFYISNADYANLKKQVGATVPVDDEDEPKAKPKKQYKNCFPNAKNSVPAATVAPKDRPKIAVDSAEDEDGLNYQDRHNLGIHAPTAEEIADVFRPEHDTPIPFVPAEPVNPEPALQARIEIICNGATIYDLEQLHSTLMDFNMRKKAVVSGTLRIVINEGK